MEPELLEQLEPDLEMASVLLTLKDLIPAKSKDQARAYIRKIVELINRQLASQLQRCVHAAQMCIRDSSWPVRSSSANARRSWKKHFSAACRKVLTML